MQDRSFVEGIAGLSRPSIAVVDERSYATVPLTPVPDPLASPLEFRSLSGFVGYILRGPDDIKSSSAVHVETPTEVALIGPVGGSFRKRENMACASPPTCKFVFGEFLVQERFMIALQSTFVQTAQRDEVIKLASIITGDEIHTQVDTGITQEVVVKAGQQLKGRVDLPNPVLLCPFRTFREVEQPESAFILRARKGSAGAELALFEADGGAWELLAMERVAEYLREALPEFEVLA
jgi:hypothetical protein